MRTNLLFWFCGIRGCGGAAGVRRTAAASPQPRRALRARPPCLRPQGANVRRTAQSSFFRLQYLVRRPLGSPFGGAVTEGDGEGFRISPLRPRFARTPLPKGEARSIAHSTALLYRRGCICLPVPIWVQKSPSAGDGRRAFCLLILFYPVGEVFKNKVQVRIVIKIRFDLFDGVDHRGVVTAAETPADGFQGFLRQHLFA